MKKFSIIMLLVGALLLAGCQTAAPEVVVETVVVEVPGEVLPSLCSAARDIGMLE